MTERISNHNNRRTHEGAPLEDGVRLDVMGANGGRFERPLTHEALARREIGQAAINTTIMRKALLQQTDFIREPLTSTDMSKDKFELAG